MNKLAVLGLVATLGVSSLGGAAVSKVNKGDYKNQGNYSYEHKYNGIDNSLEQIKVKKELLQNKLDNLETLYKEGKISYQSYNNQKIGLEKSIKELEIKEGILENKLQSNTEDKTNIEDKKEEIKVENKNTQGLEKSLEEIKLKKEILEGKLDDLDSLYESGKINKYEYKNRKAGLEKSIKALEAKEEILNNKLDALK